MHGTTFSKFLRLTGYLLRNPQDISRYLTHLPLIGKEPIDYELPWYSFKAIDFLDEYTNKNMTVFEFGGGGSTLFFARRAGSVYCAESSHEWAGKITSRLKGNEISNVQVETMPFDLTSLESFKSSAYLNSVKSHKSNIYIIDGYEESIEMRPTCFELVEKIVVEGDIIVLDDSWRYGAVRAQNKAKRVISFESVGPCRYGVTTTDIFFY
jgi:hypothetical protein